MGIFNLKDKKEYLKEVMELELNEWGTNSTIEKKKRIKRKINKYFEYVDNKYFCKLILIDNNKLVGFISIFPYDCEEEKDFTPWYSTMFVKKEYRGKGYSKILNEAILNEAKNRNIKELYLKTKLNNYYEKFGANFIKKTSNNEKIYKFEIHNK